MIERPVALHKVEAYPETCEVYVRLKGKTVWTASGTFQGQHLEVKGSSEAVALRNWREVAEGRYRSS